MINQNYGRPSIQYEPQEENIVEPEEYLQPEQEVETESRGVPYLKIKKKFQVLEHTYCEVEVEATAKNNTDLMLNIKEALRLCEQIKDPQK